MKLEDKARRYFVLLLSLLGTVALFLPFAHLSFWGARSPWDAIRFAYEGRGYSSLAIGALAAPFFLSAPVLLVWEVCRLRVVRATIIEILLAYSLGAAALLVTATTLGQVFFKLIEDPGTENAVAPIFGSFLLIVTVLLLLRNRHAAVSLETSVETILLGAYLPNALLCLLGFSLDVYTKLGVGAYITAVVSIGYAAVIIMLLRNESRWPRSSA